MSAQPMPPARHDPVPAAALRAVERDERPVRLTGPMVEAFARALDRPASSFKLADDVWGCIREFEAF